MPVTSRAVHTRCYLLFLAFCTVTVFPSSSASAGVVPRTVRGSASAVRLPLPVRPRPVAPYGFASIRARFEHSLICDNGVLIANYARAYGLSTIFVQLGGDDVSSLIARNPTTVKNLQAMIAVARVYLVVGDTSWLATPTTVPGDAVSAAYIAREYPQVAGVLYDIDPTELAAWNSNQRQALAQAYLTLATTLVTMPNATSFKDTQFVANEQLASTHVGANPRNPTFMQELEATAGIGGVQVTVPGNSAALQSQNAAAALAQMTIPFSIVAGESKYAPASYYGASQPYLESNLATLAQSAAQANPNFVAVTADGWDDLYLGSQSIFPQPSVFDGILATGPANVLIPPAGSAYLGGYVNPLGVTDPTPYQFAEFEKSIGRNLAFDLHFYGWKVFFPTKNEREDVGHGRIPIVAWNCSNHGDYNVAHGEDDALIRARADSVRNFGGPIMIRWFWEMNLSDLNNPPRTQCWDPKTDLPGGYFSPAHFIAAWQHVRTIFAEEGATNVIWLWCVANAHGGPSQYYPGDAWVDWVGLDDYDTNDISLDKMLYIPLNELSQFQEKPIMLTETGSHPAYQHSFFSETAGVLKTDYPFVRAVGYFDSKGTSQDWLLSGAGLGDFRKFAHDPYMGAMPGI